MRIQIISVMAIMVGNTGFAQGLTDWTGLSVGGAVHLNSGDATMTHRAGDNGEQNFGGDGATYAQDGGDAAVGAFVGYDFQLGNNIVLGGEVTYQAGTDIDDGDAFVQFSDARTNGAISDVLGLNARLGYAMGQVMPYVTAGLVTATLETDTSYLEGGMRRSFGGSADVNGTRVGIGALYNVSDQIFVGAEFAKTQFDDVDFRGEDSFGASAGLSGDYSYTDISIKAGYRF